MSEHDTSYNVRGVLRKDPPASFEEVLGYDDPEFIQEYFLQAGGPARMVYLPEGDNTFNFGYGVAYREQERGIDASGVFITESLESLASSLEARPDQKKWLPSRIRSIAEEDRYLGADGSFDGLLPGVEPFTAQEFFFESDEGAQWVIDTAGSQNVDVYSYGDKVTASVAGIILMESSEYTGYSIEQTDPFRVSVFE